MLSATSMKNEKLKISAMKYFVRSLKYFCALCVLCIVLMGLMLMTGTSALSLDDTIGKWLPEQPLQPLLTQSGQGPG